MEVTEQKEKNREYNRRYHEKHHAEILERGRKYRKEHEDKCKEANRRYRMKHPERILEFQRRYRARLAQTLSDVEMAERAREVSEQNRHYRMENREKLRQRDIEYQKTHREERRLYDKMRQPFQRQFRLKRRLGTYINGNFITIKGIMKRPYPKTARCELCDKAYLRLVYHHWDNTEKILAKVISDKEPLFVRGIWVCQPCNIFVHRLTEFPYLPEQWYRKKVEIESQNSQRSDVESEVYGY